MINHFIDNKQFNTIKNHADNKTDMNIETAAIVAFPICIILPQATIKSKQIRYRLESRYYVGTYHVNNNN